MWFKQAQAPTSPTPIASAEAIVHGRELTRGFDIACDAVVVGSGASGAVTAAILAKAGKRVVVLEEGPYYRREHYQSFLPSEAVRKLFRESGLVTAFPIGQTPIIAITMGRAVGGSSLLTGGVCFRIPGEIHGRWVRDLGLTELSEQKLERTYEEVEARIAVREVPDSMRSISTKRFVEGAERLGIEMKPLRRNTSDDCEGNGRCNFTCPVGAKRSVDVSYLPDVVLHGGRIVSDALVDRIELSRSGAATGVSGRILGGEGGRPSVAFRVRANKVILAAGTLHTPLLLKKSNVDIPSHVLGRNVTLHPAVRVCARFDDPVNGWDGAMQSVYSEHFYEEGIKLVGVYSAVNVLAAGLPGVGPTFMKRVRALSHTAVFGAMIHDEGGGKVDPGPFREPTLSYDMAPRDLARLRKSITILSEIAFAAGAREVYTSVFGFPPIRSMDEARKMEHAVFDAKRIECMAFHPLGSAPMSTDSRRGVVDQNGECFGAKNLYIVDGSILPTSIGVNSQVPIMAMATRIAGRLV